MRYEQRQRLKGYTHISGGPLPDCKECAEGFGYDNMEEFKNALDAGNICRKPISRQGRGICDICGSGLPGNTGPWHYRDPYSGEIVHCDACPDCVTCLVEE